MERSFSWPVVVTPETQTDLARDRRVPTRALAAVSTRPVAQEVGALRKQEDTRPEKTASDSAKVLETASTTGTGSSADEAPKETPLRPTPQSEYDGDYDARLLRGAPAVIPTRII